MSTPSEGLHTQAVGFSADATTTVGPPVQNNDIVYAMAAKGITATECFAEMETAPDLVHSSSSDIRARALDIAACMATPVLADEGNGELVKEKAAKLEARTQAELRTRYVQEITSAASRANFANRLRRLNRKRSLDDLDLHEALMSEEDIDMLDDAPRRVETGPEASSPETKRLVAAHGGRLLGDGHLRNRLELEELTEPAKPPGITSLETPDDAFLMGDGMAAEIQNTVMVAEKKVEQGQGQGKGRSYPAGEKANVVPFRVRPSPQQVPVPQEQQKTKVPSPAGKK